MNIKAYFGKFSKNQLIGIGSAIAVILLFIVFGSIYSAKKVKIGFYGLTEVQQKAVKEELSSMKQHSNSSYRFRYKVFDSSIPLTNQKTSKCDLIIAKSGKSVKELTSSYSTNKQTKVAFDRNINDGVTQNIRALSTRLPNGKISDTPILMDNIEIDLDKSYLSKTKTKNIATLNQLEQFAIKSKSDTPFPFVFQGESPSAYLDFISVCVESLSGRESLISAISIINNSKNGDYDMNTLCGQENSPLYDTIRMIQQWENDGVLTSDVYSMSNKSIQALMANNSAPIVLTTLSFHRTVSSEVISDYTSLPELSDQKVPYIPSFRSNANRSSVCSAITIVPVSSKHKTKAVGKYLLKKDTQERLSRSTGLAPVLAQCRTPDAQADDARYWISATATAQLSLADEAFTNDKARKQFIISLKDYIAATK